MELSKLDIPLGTLLALYSQGVRSIDQLLKSIDMSMRQTMRTPSSKVTRMLISKYPCLEGVEKEVFYGVEAYKVYLTELTFLELACAKKRVFFSFDESFDTDDDDEDITIDACEEELADSIRVVDEFFPIETLFIECLPDNDFTDYETLEEVIEPFAETIMEALGTSSLRQRGGEDKLCKLFNSSGEWPSDGPIYVSKDNTRKFAKVLKTLAKKASLVVKKDLP
jgi:hypothetical protein